MFINFNLIRFTCILSDQFLRLDFNFEDITWFSSWFSIEKFVPVYFVHLLHLFKLAQSLLNLFKSFVMVCFKFFQFCQKFANFQFVKDCTCSDQASNDKNPNQRLLFRSLWLVKQVRMRCRRNLLCWRKVVILVLILIILAVSLTNLQLAL